MTVAEVQATMETATQLVANIDSKLEQNGIVGQASPSSGKGSSVSGESTGQEEKSTSISKQEKEEEISEEKKKRQQSQPGPAAVSSVLHQLELLIISDDWITKEQSDQIIAGSAHAGLARTRSRTEGPRLSELGRTLVTSSSLKAYIDLLGTHHKQSIAAWLYGNTSQTLCNLFRFPNGSLHCSDCDSSLSNSVRTGIGHALRLALRDTYGPDYVSRGWRTFVQMGAPVVYISPALHLDIATYLASEFAISDVVLLKKMSSDMSDIEGRIDHDAFEAQLQSDLADGKKPLLVVGVVGSPILGQNDMISRILELRKTKCRFWVHVVGQAVAALALKEPAEMLVHVLSQVDSMTLPLAVWLGVPAAPLITLHRSVESYKPTYREKLDALPWWVASQHLTVKRITETLESAYFLSKVMLKGLSTFPQIEILGIEKPADFANRVYKGQYSPPTALIFKYKYKELCESRKETAGRKLSKESLKEKDTKEEKEPVEAELILSEEEQVARSKLQEELIEYSDSLNCWLGQGLITECRQLGLQMIELGGLHGTAFRFCPLENAASNGTTVSHVQKFVRQLADTLVIVESTVSAKRRFAEVGSKYPSLRALPVKKWAGVGAVCYVPSIVKETDPKEWNDKQRQQVSHLNLELVHSLRAVDSAFSAGESAQFGVSCVKFGMLSDEKDLNDLVHLVSERGAEIEHSQQYMDSLAEMIRQGIEAANEDLKKENDARLMQEGVMRQIPLMGSIVNWLSPLDKAAQNIKGRSFDLKTGQIQSTEVYYKHRLMSQSSVTSQEPHQKSGLRPLEDRTEEKVVVENELVSKASSKEEAESEPAHVELQ